jgi:hypothetical protein
MGFMSRIAGLPQLPVPAGAGNPPRQSGPMSRRSVRLRRSPTPRRLRRSSLVRTVAMCGAVESGFPSASESLRPLTAPRQMVQDMLYKRSCRRPDVSTPQTRLDSMADGTCNTCGERKGVGDEYLCGKCRAREQEISKIWDRWGFDREGLPLGGVWDDDAQRRDTRAKFEIDRRLEQLGLHGRWIDQLGSDDQGKPHARGFRRGQIQAYGVVAAINKKWGFDTYGDPIGKVWDDDAKRRAAYVLEEVKKVLGRLGVPLPDDWPDNWSPDEACALNPLEISESVRAERMRCGESQELGLARTIWSEVNAKWGFSDSGVPLDEKDMPRWRRVQILEEFGERLEQLGMLKGSCYFLDPDDSAWSDWFDAARSLGEEKLNYVFLGGDEPRSHAPQRSPNPGRGLSQVAGMADLKQQLMHEVLGPFTHPELYVRYRVTLPNGILFYGPPGCGKTYIARSLAEELGWFFQHCRPSDVASPYIHDTVSRIRNVFATAIEKAPSVVFIDEFEAFVPARSELGGHQQFKAEEVNEFLANLEGCAERKVLVIAATNEPEKIDPAVRRSGRFDKLILIPPPDAEARRAMLEFHLNNRPVEESLDTAGIAAVLEGYSASDIKLLVDEAARMALKRTELISADTLLTVLERVPASITADDMQRYSAFRSRGT